MTPATTFSHKNQSAAVQTGLKVKCPQCHEVGLTSFTCHTQTICITPTQRLCTHDEEGVLLLHTAVGSSVRLKDMVFMHAQHTVQLTELEGYRTVCAHGATLLPPVDTH